MSKKPSVMIETLLHLMMLDENGELLCNDELGERDTLCNRCMHDQLCNECPFQGASADEESLRALLPMIKTWELIDE